MNSEELHKLTARIKRDRKIGKILSIIVVIIFILLTWRDFEKLKETTEFLIEKEIEKETPLEILRLWILMDATAMFTALVVFTLHLIATGVFIVVMLYTFTEKKTHLLLALADRINQKADQVDADNPCNPPRNSKNQLDD